MAAFILESLVLRGSAVLTDVLAAVELRRGTSVEAGLPQTPGADDISMCHPTTSSPSDTTCYRPYPQDGGGNDPDGVNIPSDVTTPGAGRSRSVQQQELGFPTRWARTNARTTTSTSTKHKRFWWCEGGQATAAAAKKQAIATPFTFVAPVGEVLPAGRLELASSTGSNLEGC